MIGMNDDMRFATENRHGQLLAEAETRRLTDGDAGAATDFRGLRGTLHRLGSRLFGDRTVERDVAEAAVMADTLPAPTALAGDGSPALAAQRKTSAAGGCSGDHVHGQIAA